MAMNRYRDLMFNPIVQLGVGGLLGGLSGQAPAQAILGTGGQAMQLGRQLEQQEALRVLSQMPELTTLQKQLLPVAPGEVVKSLLTPTIAPVRELTKEELKQRGLPEGTIAYMTDKGIKIEYKPDASTVKSRSELKTTSNLVDRIAKDYTKLGKPVGPALLDLDRIGANIGKFFGTKYSKDYKKLSTYIDQTQTFLTKAISGAQVSDAEAERIKKLIPQLSDTEAVFEAKLIALKEYLNDAQRNYGADITSAIEGIDISKYEKMIDDQREEEFTNLEMGDDGIYDVTGG